MAFIGRLADRLLMLAGLGFDLQLDWEDEAFHRIADGLHLGSRPDLEDLPALRDAGITDVVSCLPEGRRDAVSFLEADFNTHFFPLRDSIHQDITPAFDPFCDVVARARARDGQVLVHCEAGVSRSATLAVALVMRSEGMEFYEAYCAVRARRPAILPNIGFASQLQRLEQTLQAGRGVGRARPELSSLTRYLVEVCRVPVEADLLESTLAQHDFDSMSAIRSLFDGEIPRVVQGVRV